MTKEKWGYKTTPGSNHEFCTVFDYNGKAVARHVTPENAVKIIALPDLIGAVLAARQYAAEHYNRDLVRYFEAALHKAGVTP